MPTFELARQRLDISRDAILLDTNVLVGAFLPGDQNHDVCQLIFDMPEQLLVPLSVVVESWGLLVGSRKRLDCGLQLLAWLANPGTDAYVIHHADEIDSVRVLVGEVNVDCVDALLAYMANTVTEQCELSPPLRIATFDTADFIKCMRTGRFKLKLLDMNTLEEY